MPVPVLIIRTVLELVSRRSLGRRDAPAGAMRRPPSGPAREVSFCCALLVVGVFAHRGGDDHVVMVCGRGARRHRERGRCSMTGPRLRRRLLVRWNGRRRGDGPRHRSTDGGRRRRRLRGRGMGRGGCRSCRDRLCRGLCGPGHPAGRRTQTAGRGGLDHQNRDSRRSGRQCHRRGCRRWRSHVGDDHTGVDRSYWQAHLGQLICSGPAALDYRARHHGQG